MTPRLITLNYPATCRGCGTALPADTEAYWAQGAGTACRSCGPAAFTRPRQRRPRPPASTSRPSTRPQPAAPTRAAPAGRPENAPPAPPDQGRWAAYCDYLLACVEAEARESHSTLEGSRGWTALDVNLVTDTHARVPATPDLATQARAGAATLRVGWPVLTRPTEDGTHRLVPLLVVEVDVSADPAPVLVPLTERPTLNPRLADAGLDRSDIALAEELVRTAEDLPAAALAGHLLTMLALDSEDLTGPPHPPTTTGFAQNTVLLEHLEGADRAANPTAQSGCCLKCGHVTRFQSDRQLFRLMLRLRPAFSQS